jgi:hypothetical protein
VLKEYAIEEWKRLSEMIIYLPSSDCHRGFLMPANSAPIHIATYELIHHSTSAFQKKHFKKVFEILLLYSIKN